MGLEPGSIVGGRYRAETRLGAGGVGEVWAGTRVDDGAHVALKTLLPAASAHRELVTRFRREAAFLARIRSKYVSKVVDFLEDPEHGLVLVLELVPGESLKEILDRRCLSVEEALDLCWDVAGGLADLHRQQIIHRDLKPGNVIVRRAASGRLNATIVDFGMSRLTATDDQGEEITALTRADIAVGTIEYMAPEQILNSREVTASADLYALGAMLHRAVAGRHVFGDLADVELARQKFVTDPPPLVTGRTDALGRGFESLVNRMLQRMPKNRIARAEDVFAELLAFTPSAAVDLRQDASGGPAAASSPTSSPGPEAVPFGLSPFASSPVASSPFASSPVASSPFASSPVASSPFASSPVASSPLSSSPIAASPDALRISNPVPSGAATTLDASARPTRSRVPAFALGALLVAGAGTAGAMFLVQRSAPVEVEVGGVEPAQPDPPAAAPIEKPSPAPSVEPPLPAPAASLPKTAASIPSVAEKPAPPKKPWVAPAAPPSASPKASGSPAPLAAAPANSEKVAPASAPAAAKPSSPAPLPLEE